MPDNKTVGSVPVRRMVDVDVKEVSLVDRAANLRQFLVIKRLEEGNMGAFLPNERSKEMQTQKGLTGQDSNAPILTPAQVEEQKQKELAEKAAAEKAAAEKACGSKPGVDEEEMDEETEKEGCASKEKTQKMMPPGALIGMLRGLKGAPEGAVEELCTFLEGKQPTKKSLDGVRLAMMDDGSVVIAGEPVEKSKKFTGNRLNTVKEVVTQLLTLANEIDPEVTKSIVASFNPVGSTSSPERAVDPVGTETQKECSPMPNEEMKKQADEINKQAEVIKSLTAKIEEVTKSLESISDARQAPKAIEGGTDTKVVKKCLWDGLL